MIIHATESRKLVKRMNFKCQVIAINDDEFDELKFRNPYAQCKKITIESLEDLPINLKHELLKLPEVQSLIREDKINKIINND